MLNDRELETVKQAFVGLGVTVEVQETWNYVYDATGEKLEIEEDGEMIYQTVNGCIVNVSMADAKRGSFSSRRIETLIDAKAAKSIVADMKKDLAARGKNSRKHIAAERSLDAE